MLFRLIQRLQTRSLQDNLTSADTNDRIFLFFILREPSRVQRKATDKEEALGKPFDVMGNVKRNIKQSDVAF